MVGSSMNDDRVPYWLPLKWVARLRNHLSSQEQSDNPLVVCNVDYYAGHFGEEGTYRRFEQVHELTGCKAVTYFFYSSGRECCQAFMPRPFYFLRICQLGRINMKMCD